MILPLWLVIGDRGLVANVWTIPSPQSPVPNHNNNQKCHSAFKHPGGNNKIVEHEYQSTSPPGCL